MEKKFTEIERGTFQKLGNEYSYVIELGDDFDKKKDVRIRIIEEKPLIQKIRTRYDPEITMFGDKNASMELMLGYDMKQINNALKYFLFTLLTPFYVIGMTLLIIKWDNMSKFLIPDWIMQYAPILKWTLSGLLVFSGIIIVWKYYKMNMTMLAEYLKGRDLKKILLKEGFKQ